MAPPSSVRAGIVLPEAFFGEAEWQNAEKAIQFADEAASQGVGGELVIRHPQAQAARADVRRVPAPASRRIQKPSSHAEALS